MSQDRPTWTTADGTPLPVERREALELPEVVVQRYRRVSLLGRGGMGSVWRAHDAVLGRHVALKVVSPGPGLERLIQRFEEEARIAAQLEHPGIIPVHDYGRLPDGRPWFVMKEVRGRTLQEVMVELHQAHRLGRHATEDGFTFRRLLEAFVRICETVAFAHRHGVLHRDLKPNNLMLGEYGEVLVLDWGLARVWDEAEDTTLDLPPRGPEVTRVGAITGTPSYMAPEQARGEAVGPATDVHALGATLYDLLCDRPPRTARSVPALLLRVANGSPLDPPSVHAAHFPVDAALDALCLKALAHDPAARHPHAGGLASELTAWLDGALRREQARELVRTADALAEQGSADASRARELRSEAAGWLVTLGELGEIVEKERAWILEDQASELELGVVRAQHRTVELLRQAVAHAPGWTEPEDRLADRVRDQHEALERDGRHAEAEVAEKELRSLDRSGRHTNWLRGVAAVSLVTDPPGAEVRAFRFVERGRRLVPVFDRELGRTPLRRMELPRGSWWLTLRREGHAEVGCPVSVDRLEHWDGVPPGASEPVPVRLPVVGELGPEEHLVPPGWFWSGDDRDESTLPLRRMWADGFLARRHPVTLGEYLTYLNDLATHAPEGVLEAAIPLLPDSDEPFLGRSEAGTFLGIRADRSGSGWDSLPRGPDTPICQVTWPQAVAYADWWAARTGRPWRLPMEREWQKAARGADRRDYPWGDHFEPAWSHNAVSARGGSIAPVTGRPSDVSPYGVQGLAGNVLDWTLGDPADPPGQDLTERVLVRVGTGPNRVVVGGSVASRSRASRVSQRSPVPKEWRAIRLGFRLFCSGW